MSRVHLSPFYIIVVVVVVVLLRSGLLLFLLNVFAAEILAVPYILFVSMMYLLIETCFSE